MFRFTNNLDIHITIFYYVLNRDVEAAMPSTASEPIASAFAFASASTTSACANKKRENDRLS